MLYGSSAPSQRVTVTVPQRVPAFGDLVRVKRIRHLIGLKEGKTEQLFHRRCCQCFVLFDRERRQAMTGLRRDDNTSTATGDDIAEFLQDERRAIQVDFQDRCR